MDVNLAAFLDEFRSEMVEYLRTLNDQLLRWEREPADVAPIRDMFLAAHTIKGAAAMMELDSIVEVMHAIEDVLARFRQDRCSLDAATADLLFRALDVLQELIARAQPGGTCGDPRVIPLVAALRGAAEAPAIDATTGRRQSADRPRALLIEHSPTLRMLDSLQLADGGFDVDPVANADQALSAWRAHPYDLVVTALETQGLRGLELAAVLRGLPGGEATPIILISSDEHPEHQARAQALAITPYVRKRSRGDLELGQVAQTFLTGPAAGRQQSPRPR